MDDNLAIPEFLRRQPMEKAMSKQAPQEQVEEKEDAVDAAKPRPTKSEFVAAADVIEDVDSQIEKLNAEHDKAVDKLNAQRNEASDTVRRYLGRKK